MVKQKTTSMTFWEHIEEFRRRIIVSALFIAAGAGAGYFLFPFFIGIVQQTIGEQLYAFHVTEGFLVRLETALSIGIFISLPIVLSEILLFVLPALTSREKRMLLLFLVSSYTLFLGGIAFAFTGVLPVSIRFLQSAEFFPHNVARMISFREFIKFFMSFLIAFGVCFQFPIIMLLVMKLNLLPFRFFTRNFKYMVIAILILAAVITPPDVISQIALAVPMISLYGLTLLVAGLTGMGRKAGRDT